MTAANEWDECYEDGYGKLMERACERPRYQSIGQLVDDLPAHASLLDVGCGIGTLADHLPELRYVGIDISRAAIETAQERRTGTFLCADAETFQPGETFDVILFNESLYYLSDPLGQLARYRDFLSDDGSLIVSIWLPDAEHPRHGPLVELADSVLAADALAQCPMSLHRVGDQGGLQWNVIRISRPPSTSA